MLNSRPIQIILIATLLFAADAKAFVFSINYTKDTTNLVSLRGAIKYSNKIGGNNIILLGPTVQQLKQNPQQEWVFRLTINGADENQGNSGDLDINRGNLTIIGTSAKVIIDASDLGDRVFQVFSNAHLKLMQLTVTGGNAPGNGYGIWANGESGGAIYNAGDLFLYQCVITNNASGTGNIVQGNGGGTDGGDGGGIYNVGTLIINNSVITGNSCGSGADGAFGGNGGGIANEGTCNLTHSIIMENQSGAGGSPEGNALGFSGSGGNGGGIFNSGKMIIKTCLVGANVGGQGGNGGSPGIGTIFSSGGLGGNGGDGAGIYNNGNMQLAFSSVVSNQSGHGGDGGKSGMGGNAGKGGDGAGIFNANKLNLNTCTISENVCGDGGNGGGGAIAAANGALGGSGGGILNRGTLDLTSCTIVLNKTGLGGNGGNSEDLFGNSQPAEGGQGGDGGGILNMADRAITTRNTLIGLNAINSGGAGGTNFPSIYFPGSTEPPPQIGLPGDDGIGLDVAGTFKSLKYNLIGVADGSIGFVDGFHSLNKDIVGSIARPFNPSIEPLQMNGGFTPTHALKANSPAIDQGNSFGNATDQRGKRRSYNNTITPNASDGSDIGAFELQVTLASFPSD